MKKFMTLIVLVVSFYSYSASAISLGYFSMMSSYVSDCKLHDHCKEAVRIVDDSDDYFQTGYMSEFLLEKVKATQSINLSFSEMDALDEVIANSLEVIKQDK